MPNHSKFLGYTEPGSSRGTDASHPIVWEGELQTEGETIDVRVIELDPDDLHVQIQYELDGLWDTCTNDSLTHDAIYAALVALRKAANYNPHW